MSELINLRALLKQKTIGITNEIRKKMKVKELKEELERIKRRT